MPVHAAHLTFSGGERGRSCAAEIARRIRFERMTHCTIATPEALRVNLEKTRRRGYAVDDEELEEGLRCIAVPMPDVQRLPVAAVSVSGPSFRVTAQKLPYIANHLVQCVRGISLDMGYTPAGRGARAVVSA
jgi:DNA-binding IclR family transcriptional regulator